MIKVNVVEQYWFNDAENEHLSEDGQRMYHTIKQTPMEFDTEADFFNYIEDEGLELLDSWYSYPDGSRIVDYGTGEWVEMSVHVIDDEDWPSFAVPTVEYEVIQ